MLQHAKWDFSHHCPVYSNASTQTETSIRGNVSREVGDRKDVRSETSSYHGAGAEKPVLQPIQDEDPIRRRLKPKCKEDVRLLFSELNLWRKKKLDEIEQRRDITSETRIQMRSKVLSQEVILLRKINSINYRLTVSEKKREVDQILNQMTTPQYWKVSSGEEIQIHTVEMDQSSELIQMYQQLDESNADQSTGMSNLLYNVE